LALPVGDILVRSQVQLQILVYLYGKGSNSARVNQSINLVFKRDLSNKQQLQDHRGEEQLKGKSGVGVME